MTAGVAIRSETGADAGAITEVTVAAFKSLEICNHTEQFIVSALRAAEALTLSLVAEVGLAGGRGSAAGVLPALSFDGQTPQGTVAFHDAFKATG